MGYVVLYLENQVAVKAVMKTTKVVVVTYVRKRFAISLRIMPTVSPFA
jgi:hypothetical protein